MFLLFLYYLIKIPTKRRNNGRGKKNKGHSDVIRCLNCGRVFPKDKAVKRFQMRNMVDGSSKRDIEDNYAYDTTENRLVLPKIYVKQCYCVSCAIHARVVRVRSQTRGDRDKRYTTKLRQNTKTNITGGFALPASSGFK